MLLLDGTPLSVPNPTYHSCSHFPLDGEVQQVFLTDIQLPEELGKLDVALRRLRAQTDILNTFEAWYFLFERYYEENIRDLESESVRVVTIPIFVIRIRI